jgi:hypothetical protein
VWLNFEQPKEQANNNKPDNMTFSFFIFAERLSSAMNALGAERAARSTIRDKRVHSL